MPLIRGSIGPTRLRLRLPFGSAESHLVGQYLRQRARSWDYDPRTHVSTPTRQFYVYNKRMQELRIPVGYREAIEDLLRRYNYQLDLCDEATIVPTAVPIPIRPLLNGRPLEVREHQQDAIQFFLNDTAGMYGMPLATGLGKTFVAIYAIAQRGIVSMILTSGLVDQWVDKWLQYTTLAEDDVYVIQQKPSLTSLFKSDKAPKVFVCSLETIRNYVNQRYPDLPPYAAFLRQFGIGVKVVDEVHLNYGTIVNIDLASNVPYNFYLSATPTRNESTEARIFRTIFPEEIMFEPPDYVKYVRGYFYGYYGNVSSKRVMRLRGYMQAKYESEIFKRPTKFKDFMERILFKLVDSHFINVKHDGERLLIFFATNKMCSMVAERLAQYYPALRVVTYMNDDKPTVHEDLGVDIIVSTPRKCGVGTDIAELRTLINCVSTNAATTILQIVGRLRKLKRSAPIYVDLHDLNLVAHERHYRTKLQTLRNRLITCNEFTL